MLIRFGARVKGSAPVVTVANNGGEGWRESCLRTVRRGRK